MERKSVILFFGNWQACLVLMRRKRYKGTVGERTGTRVARDGRF